MERRSGRRRWRWIVFIPAGLMAAVAFWGLLDAVDGASARTVWNRTWTGADGQELGGYLIVPTDARRLVPSPATRTIVTAERSANDRYPAVLLIHERWGLTVDTARLADQLAADGYIVLAVDALRGRRAVSVPGALALSAMTPNDRIDRDIDRALDELAALPDVDLERIAVAGFGFGAVRAMGLGNRRADIAATALFYGTGPFSTAEEIGLLGRSGPVLGIYGAADRTIPTEDIERFESLLLDAGVDARFTIYEGAGHAFVDAVSVGTDPVAATAWDRFRLFLLDAL